MAATKIQSRARGMLARKERRYPKRAKSSSKLKKVGGRGSEQADQAAIAVAGLTASRSPRARLPSAHSSPRRQSFAAARSGGSNGSGGCETVPAKAPLSEYVRRLMRARSPTSKHGVVSPQSSAANVSNLSPRPSALKSGSRAAADREESQDRRAGASSLGSHRSSETWQPCTSCTPCLTCRLLSFGPAEVCSYLRVTPANP